jgi:cytochrome c55X
MPDSRPLACLAAIALPAIAWAGDLAPAAEPLPPERRAALERLVLQDCGSCHGMSLKGGLGADLTRAALAGREPREIARIVLDGVPGTAMPPWRPLLTEAEAAWIADYLIEGGAN